MISDGPAKSMARSAYERAKVADEWQLPALREAGALQTTALLNLTRRRCACPRFARCRLTSSWRSRTDPGRIDQRKA